MVFCSSSLKPVMIRRKSFSCGGCESEHGRSCCFLLSVGFVQVSQLCRVCFQCPYGLLKFLLKSVAVDKLSKDILILLSNFPHK